MAFFAGAFLINVLPHFLSGVAGTYFPTPFANPPGEGLSSPVVNVAWGAFNILIGGVLFHYAKVCSDKKLWIPVAIGGLLMAFNLAHHFGTVLNK